MPLRFYISLILKPLPLPLLLSLLSLSISASLTPYSPHKHTPPPPPPLSLSYTYSFHAICHASLAQSQGPQTTTLSQQHYCVLSLPQREIIDWCPSLHKLIIHDGLSRHINLTFDRDPQDFSKSPLAGINNTRSLCFCSPYQIRPDL